MGRVSWAINMLERFRGTGRGHRLPAGLCYSDAKVQEGLLGQSQGPAKAQGRLRLEERERW